MNILELCRNCQANDVIGWEIQHMTAKGWKPVSMVFCTQAEAENHLDVLHTCGIDCVRTSKFRIATLFH